MLITLQRHAPGHTPEACELNRLGECQHKAHLFPETYHVPDALVRVLIARMQSASFAVADVAAAVPDDMAALLPSDMRDRILRCLTSTFLRRKLIAREAGRDGDVFLWVGPKGGTR